MYEDNEQFLEAILNNNTNIVKTFIENGANVNLIDESTGMSVLMLAAKKHNYELCELLLSHGADLFLKNNTGETIFDVFKEDIKLICWLEVQNKRLKNQKFKDAALKGDISYITEHFSEVNTDTVSWSFVHTPSILVLDYLLNKGIDINVKSIFLQKYSVGKYEYALTSLMQGCQKDNLDKVKWLLEQGARADITCQYIRIVHYKDEDIDDRRELSALDYARASKNQEMIDLLLSYFNNSIIHQSSQPNLNKKLNDKKYKRLSENETKEYPRQLKFLSANSDEKKRTE